MTRPGRFTVYSLDSRMRKKARARVRHRSPVAPPSRVIDKRSYRRSREKAGWRKEVEGER
jgi:hypothetical protein